jgi:hypothetical protein
MPACFLCGYAVRKEIIMDYIEAAEDFIQKYPIIYNSLIVFLVLCICAVADFVVKKIILRGLKQILCRLSDCDGVWQGADVRVRLR